MSLHDSRKSRKSDYFYEISSDVENINRSSIQSNYIVAFGYAYVQTIICVVGLILNLINFSIFVRSKFKAPAYILMTFLSFADALTLGLRIPQGYIFVPEFTGHSTDMVLFVYVYNIFVETPITNMTENISAWLTVVWAIERYVAMKHPHLAKQHFTPPKIRQLVYGIITVAVIINTPYFVLQNVSIHKVNETLELYSEMTSFSQSSYYAIYSWLRIVLVQIVPLFFLCITNCLLFSLVSKHNQRFRRKLPTPVLSEQRSRNWNKEPGLKAESACACNEMSCDYLPEFSDGCIQMRSCKVSCNRCPTNAHISNRIYQSGSPVTVSQLVSETPHDLQPFRGPPQNQITRHIRRGQQANEKPIDRCQRMRAAQNKLTLLLIVIILLFLIGQVPQSFAYIRVFTSMGLCAIDKVEHCTSHRIYRMISVNLAQVAFASTFMVYFLLNRDFRQTLVCQTHACVKYVCSCKRMNVKNQIK